MAKYLRLEDLEIYKMSMEIGEDIWKIVDTWNYFQKDTIGKQMVRSGDSIAANIAEGYGRYSYKENRQFCVYARGSLMETKTWIVKTHNRKLITTEIYDQFINRLKTLHLKLNAYIKTIKKSIS